MSESKWREMLAEWLGLHLRRLESRPRQRHRDRLVPHSARNDHPKSCAKCGEAEQVRDLGWDWETQTSAQTGAELADALLTSPVLAQMKREWQAEALREFADSRGVNIGNEDSEWWQGYRQAQRECLRDAIDRAEAKEATR